jgi:hypothetical protein
LGPGSCSTDKTDREEVEEKRKRTTEGERRQAASAHKMCACSPCGFDAAAVCINAKG